MSPGTFGTDCQSRCSPGVGPRVQAVPVTEGQFCILDEICRRCCTMVSQPVPVIPWGSLRPPWLTLTSQLNQGIRAPSLLKGEKMPVLWGPVDKREKAAYRKTLPTLWFLTSVSNPVTYSLSILAFGMYLAFFNYRVKGSRGYTLATQVPVPKVGRWEK